MNNYSVDIKGDGNTYSLFVSGIWKSYDIELVNCHEDKNGISKSVLPTNIINSNNTNSATR